MMNHCQGDSLGRVSKQEVVSLFSLLPSIFSLSPILANAEKSQMAQGKHGLQNPSSGIREQSVQGGEL